MFLVGQVSGLVENFNVWIHSDIINVINVKLYMIVLLTDLHLFMPLSVTLTTFQGHSSVEHFWLKILHSCPNKLKLSTSVNCVH